MDELDNITFKKAAKGDQRAFKKLYDFYAPFMWRNLYRMTGGDQAMASEILQEAFVRIYKSLASFKGESAVSTWMYKITYHAALTFLSKVKKFKHDQFQDSITGSRSTDNYDNKEMVNLILKELSIEERFLLTAREVDGLSFEELALIQSSTPGAVRTKLHRIKESIRNRFSSKTPLLRGAI